MSGIKDIAELAGVSLSTASIVINGKSQERKISEATQKRVYHAMQELDYIPNVSAKTLRKGEAQKYIVALFWSFDFRSIMMNRFLYGLQKRIHDENANMNIVVHPYQTGELYKEKYALLGGEFHAAIIANANGNDLVFLKNEFFPTPIILYNRLLDEYCSVNVNDRQIGQMAAKHLYDNGYRKPCVVHGTKNFPGATLREDAFIEAMRSYGVEPYKEGRILAENSLRGGFEYGQNLLTLKESDIPNCLFCSSDSIALGIINACTGTDLIPKKLGIIAIGNIDPQYSAYCTIPITVINIPIEQMAAECYTLLRSGMYNTTQEVISKYFETELFVRRSTERNGLNMN